MSRGQRRRARVDVGSHVMICADSMPDILADMALVDKDDNILKGVQMFGTVKSKTVNHFAVELPAAEETIQFLKEKVTCVESKKRVPVMYVLHDNNIKTLEGLQLPPGFVPKDFFPRLTRQTNPREFRYKKPTFRLFRILSQLPV